MKDILICTRELAEEALACHRRGKLCFWLPGARPPGETSRPDNRTDIYCIGCTLFSALISDADGLPMSYRPEFYRLSQDLLAASPIWDTIAAPLRQDLEPPLGNLLRRCLAPRPQGRYSCCEELLADLDRAIAALRAQKPPS